MSQSKLLVRYYATHFFQLSKHLLKGPKIHERDGLGHVFFGGYFDSFSNDPAICALFLLARCRSRCRARSFPWSRHWWPLVELMEVKRRVIHERAMRPRKGATTGCKGLCSNKDGVVHKARRPCAPPPSRVSRRARRSMLGTQTHGQGIYNPQRYVLSVRRCAFVLRLSFAVAS